MRHRHGLGLWILLAAGSLVGWRGAQAARQPLPAALDRIGLPDPRPPTHAVAAGDVNGDGLADLVFVGGAEGRTSAITLRLGAGLGHDAALSTLELQPISSWQGRPVVTDVNGDGLADLALDVVHDGQLALAVLHGRPDWPARQWLDLRTEADLYLSVDSPEPPPAPGSLDLRQAWGDLDGDGAVDLVLSVAVRDGFHRAGAGLAPFDAVMRGVGGLRGRQVFRADTTLVGRCGPLASPADATGDGVADLYSSTCGQRLALVAGGADWPARLDIGPAALWSLRTEGWLDLGQAHLALADMNGDGTADPVLASDSAVYTWPGGPDLARHGRISGTTTIFTAGAVDLAPGAMDWRPSDWNGDGRLDLLARPATATASAWRLLLGRAVMPEVVDLSAAPPDRQAPHAAGWAAVGDLDGDGTEDLLLRKGAGEDWAVWHGDPGAVAVGALPETAPSCAFCPGAEYRFSCAVGLSVPVDGAVPAQYYPSVKPIFLPLVLNDGQPARATPVTPRRASPTPDGSATPSPTQPATLTPTVTPTAEPPTPTPTEEPDQDAITFPPLAAKALGNCTAEVHDRYFVRGPDGLKYRSWHAVTVPVDLANPGGETCTFRHEHGDDPLSGRFAGEEPPPFGYVSRMARDYEMIKAHGGYKVLYHAREQAEGVRAEWRIAMHQGTMGFGRVTNPGHEIQIDVIEDAAGGLRRTSVKVQGDTGRLSPACGPRIGDRLVPDKACAQRARMYEVWYTLAMIGAGKARGAAFVAAPGFATTDAGTYLDPADMTKVFAASELIESGLPLGDPQSQYLGNTHLIEHPDFGWGNMGPELFWTDVTGRALGTEAAAACVPLTCLEQRVPSGLTAVYEDDVNFVRPRFDLPLGATGN